jgi:hypothetical protein
LLKTIRRAGVIALSAVAVPAMLVAQATRPAGARAPATPSAAASAETRGWMDELQRISARLQAAHNRAMQDAQLRAQQEALMRDAKNAMLRTDPGLDAAADRVKAMEAEALTAQQRGDRARLMTLRNELAQIQRRFVAAQNSAMQQPAIAQRARAFETQLRARMLQVEPQTDQLLERANELRNRLLRATLQQQRPQGQQRPNGPLRQP